MLCTLRFSLLTTTRANFAAHSLLQTHGKARTWTALAKERHELRFQNHATLPPKTNLVLGSWANCGLRAMSEWFHQKKRSFTEAMSIKGKRRIVTPQKFVQSAEPPCSTARPEAAAVRAKNANGRSVTHTNWRGCVLLTHIPPVAKQHGAFVAKMGGEALQSRQTF